MKKRALLMTILWIGSLSCLWGQEYRYFAQVADGDVPGVFRFQTSLVFVNTGSAADIEIEFFSEQGQPINVNLPPYGSGSSFSIPIAAGATVSTQTPGLQYPPQAGYARFLAPSSVGGSVVFSGVDGPTGTLLFESGVPATGAVGSFSVYLDSLGEKDTGLAVIGIDPGGTAVAEESGFTVTLYDKASNELGSRFIALSPGQKKTSYINGLFEGSVAEAAKEMEGSVTVQSQGIDLAATTLRQFVSALSFPDAVPTLTTLPVIGTSSPSSAEWQLVWSDEFDVDGPPDPTKWSFETGQIGGNNELSFYTPRPENARIEGGKLVIEARKETYGSAQYTSARLRTIKTSGPPNNTILFRNDWKYGRFEIRARLPEGRGMWPAIWMLPTDNVYGTWAASGEVDIMELVGHEPNTIHGTLHYGGVCCSYNRYNGMGYRLPDGKFIDGFHVFALEWEEGEMRWYLDGKLWLVQTNWWTGTNSQTPNTPFPAPFDQPFHLIMNLAVGGNWPGSPDATTAFPQRLEVDYVRVYQKP